MNKTIVRTKRLMIMAMMMAMTITANAMSYTAAKNEALFLSDKMAYDERRSAIVLELTVTLEEDAVSDLCCQFPIPADYDGVGLRGTKFVFYL